MGASWYCWYSLTRSFMLDSASVNSISSIPSPVYQCKKAFLVIKLLIIDGSFLVLLVLADKIVHVGLGRSELFGDPLEQLLDGGGVANEGGSHLEPPWWDVADSSLDIVSDPLHEVGAVLVLDVEHLLVHLLHGHAATENSSNCEISAVSRI